MFYGGGDLWSPAIRHVLEIREFILRKWAIWEYGSARKKRGRRGGLAKRAFIEGGAVQAKAVQIRTGVPKPEEQGRSLIIGAVFGLFHG